MKNSAKQDSENMETKNKPKQKWIPNPNYATATHEVDPKLPVYDQIETLDGVTMEEWYGSFAKIKRRLQQSNLLIKPLHIFNTTIFGW